MPDPLLSLSLSDKSLKKQRLERTLAILMQHPTKTKTQVVNIIAQEVGVDRATVYGYLREIKANTDPSVISSNGTNIL